MFVNSSISIFTVFFHNSNNLTQCELTGFSLIQIYFTFLLLSFILLFVKLFHLTLYRNDAIKVKVIPKLNRKCSIQSSSKYILLQKGVDD